MLHQDAQDAAAGLVRPRAQAGLDTTQGTLDADAFLDFVCGPVADLSGGAAGLGGLPAGWHRDRCVVIVLDNDTVGRARPVKQALVGLARVGSSCVSCRPPGPELNLVEPEWRQAQLPGQPGPQPPHR